MTLITAIFEHGIFRPLEPLELPDKTRVTIALPDSADNDQVPDVREVLSRRYASGHQDTSALHNDHQP